MGLSAVVCGGGIGCLVSGILFMMAVAPIIVGVGGLFRLVVDTTQLHRLKRSVAVTGCRWGWFFFWVVKLLRMAFSLALSWNRQRE